MDKDDYDKRYEEWKKTHNRGSWKTRKVGDRKEIMKQDEGLVEAIEERFEKTVEDVEREIEEVEEKIKEYVEKKPLHVKILKVLAVLIPVVIILFLINANFLADQEFNYFYDIGSEGENVLTPVERISEAVTEGDLTYRNMTGHLVYFDVPIARGSEKVYAQIKMKDNFPEDGKISLGAKDEEEWHYLYKSLYNPLLNVGGYDSKGMVYRLNENLPLVDRNGLKNLSGIIVASTDFVPEVNMVEGYEAVETEIEMSLRGAHTFYLYASDYLDIEVEKRDINWYEGSDELIMVLYDLDGNVVELSQVGDDGVVEDSKVMGHKQRGEIVAAGLSEGVYKLEIKDFDGLITKITANTNKIVAEKVFLADSSIYGVDTKQSKLYFDYRKDVTMRLITYHEAGLQRILFTKDGVVQPFNFNIEDEPVFKDLTPGSYAVTFPKNDLVVESPEYFAFTPEGYFRPWKQKVVSVNSPEWIMDSVDYLITDYVVPQREGDWIIVETEFDINEDGLWVNDQGMLSMVFNVPHLATEGSNYTIPIDWIDVTVYKPGIWEDEE
ncbi:MAG: hypothetical protein ABH864_00585 [archaeon]